MADELPHSRTARQAAEQALVRVVHHYGDTPEFVLLGGLVPELLCSGSGMLHAGVDVQVDLEIAAGAVNTVRLEQALANAEFSVDQDRIWRWRADIDGRRTVVKFELLPGLRPRSALWGQASPCDARASWGICAAPATQTNDMKGWCRQRASEGERGQWRLSTAATKATKRSGKVREAFGQGISYASMRQGAPCCWSRCDRVGNDHRG